MIALAIVAVLLWSACGTTRSIRRRVVPAEIVDWQEKQTFGIDRVYLVKVSYRDSTGALCMTTVEMDQLTWARVRRGAPCIVPYQGRYTVSACPGS